MVKKAEMTIGKQILALVLVLMFGVMLNADGQKRRRKTRSHRTTTTAIRPPATLSPAPSEPEVVSRAEDDLTGENGSTTGTNGSINPDLPKPSAPRPVKIIATPVNKNKSADEDRSLVDLERLSLAEGRAEAFRKQLSDVIERENTLRSKIEQLDYQMNPEVIQSEASTIGSLRPEEVRDSRRKMLENEKTRTNDQLNTVMESRTRLESAIANADALVNKLRARVEAETDGETQTSSDKITTKDSTLPQVPDN